MRRMVMIAGMVAGLVSGAYGLDNDPNADAFYECMTGMCLPAASQCESDCGHDRSSAQCMKNCKGMEDLCMKTCLVWSYPPGGGSGGSL
jgi:hypothetical protein